MGSWPKKIIATVTITVAMAMTAHTGFAQNQERTFTANYKDTNILEVIKAVQEATGKLFVIDPRVKGQITVMSSAPLTQDEYYKLFLAVLNTSGFTAIENDNIVTILPNKEARSAPLPFLSNNNNKSSEYVQEIFKLNNVSAAQVLPTIRPLVPQGGESHMAAFPASNVIIMVDTVANVERIRGLLDQIDQAAIPETEMVSLKFAEAEEVVRILEQIERNSDPANKAAVATKLQVIADKRTNSVLITGEPRQRRRVKELIERIDRPQQQNGNARVIYLEYADAEQVAQVLTNVVQNMAKLNPDEKPTAQNAAIVADTDTNSIIITADIETVNSLQDVISRLDIQRAQVLVEAVIVEVTDRFQKNLGFNWLYRTEEGGFVGNMQGTLDETVLGRIVSGALEQNRESALGTLGAALSQVTGQSIGVGRLGDGYDLLGLINFLQGNSEANILSTPSILTTDNHTAKITVGQQISIQTGSFSSVGNASSPQSPFQTFDRQSVGTIMEVTPHVNEGEKVALEIIQEASSVSPNPIGGQVAINERKLETQVAVKDGETIVLGGLISEIVTQSEQKIPLLGDIPFLGNLFKNTSNSVDKTNLYIFIKPTIVRTDEDLRGATAEKYKSIRNAQESQRKGKSLLINKKNLPLLPDWDSVVEKAEMERQEREAKKTEAKAQAAETKVTTSSATSGDAAQ